MYCCGKCRTYGNRGLGLKDPERRCEWCGKRLELAQRADARFCSSGCRREANSARPCFYCGMPAEGRDHFVPRVFVEVMRSAGIVARRSNVIVPACQECNSTAGSEVFATVGAKRSYIRAAYRKKYARLISAPHHSEEELAELGHGLRSRVRAGQEAQRLMLARLRWPNR